MASPRLDFLLGGPLSGKWAAVWASLGGLCQALAWPRAGLWLLTWLGPLMLWRAIYGQSPAKAFKLGWYYGVVLSLVSAMWLADVMSGYGGLGPFGGTMVLLTLVAYLALFQGAWALLSARLATQAPVPDGRLIVPALCSAVLWTGFDQLKNLLLTGFNWSPLAGGLTGAPSLIGAADLIGVYGLALLVSMTSFLLAQSLLGLRKNPGCAGARAIAAGIILIFQASYGSYSATLHEERYASAQASGQARQVSIIQPSIPQDQKWDPKFRETILGRFSDLLIDASEAGPWLILWPETSAPFLHGIDQVETKWLEEKAAEAASQGIGMLVGIAALDYDDDGYRRLKNRAWLVGPGGSLGSYDKTHLVPFGEYIPLADVLPFLKTPFAQGILGAAGNYSPGRARANLSLDSVPFGVLICFESIFPYQARDRALMGARFLVVTTNDGWFGLSSAPEQHLWQASMRAVETRLPLMRAANNGISAHISPSGRVLARSKQNEIASFSWPLGLPEPGPPTVFVRYGYYLAPACGLFSALAALIALGRWAKGFKTRRRDRPKTGQSPKRPPVKMMSGK